METRFSEQINDIVGYAIEEAMRTGSYSICPDHLALALIRHADNDACNMLNLGGIDLKEMKSALDTVLCKDSSVPYNHEEMVQLSNESQKIMGKAASIAESEGKSEVGPGHLLRAICKSICFCSTFLSSKGFNPDLVPAKKKNSPRVIHIAVRKSDIFS